jgi:hypothetical protein
MTSFPSYFVCYFFPRISQSLGAICISMKSHFVEEQLLFALMNLLMPPLLAKIESLADDDVELFPVLDCFRSISIAIGPAMAPCSIQLFFSFVFLYIFIYFICLFYFF